MFSTEIFTANNNISFYKILFLQVYQNYNVVDCYYVDWGQTNNPQRIAYHYEDNEWLF